jgi:signal peptidase I
MRPTLKEDDYLVVSKTEYGLNVPLQVKHFYFDPDLVKRGDIVVFNGANIDIENCDTTYFYLFPGKKQFVKRLIGKPGDILYFYGGKIYGVDAEGKEITDLNVVNQYEHIPFIRFDGKAETYAPQNGVFSSVVFHQMNLPIAKLNLTPIGTITGELLASQKNQRPTQYADLLGMKHFAMARLLTKEQLEKIHGKQSLEDGILYLELTHHPSLQGASLLRDEYNRRRPELSSQVSFIPLQSEHLRAISEHITTCRFTVKNEMACRLGWNPSEIAMYLPKLPNVPDGTYEIQDGKAYKLPFPNLPLIGLFTNGVIRELPKDHPLYAQTPEMIQKLYNFGIEFLNQYAPIAKNQRAVPSRYAYFRDGSLYLLGAPIIKKGDPALIAFQKREEQKKLIATSYAPYFPFEDLGSPSLEEIQKNGVRVPDKMYLVLGDNHAMSADSRDFGFVPEDNLKGSVSFLFSPPGDRFGFVPQPKKSLFTLPSLIAWIGFSLALAGSNFYQRRKLKKLL